MLLNHRSIRPSVYRILGPTDPRSIGPAVYQTLGLKDPWSIGPFSIIGLSDPRSKGPLVYRAVTVTLSSHTHQGTQSASSSATVQISLAYSHCNSWKALIDIDGLHHSKTNNIWSLFTNYKVCLVVGWMAD